MTNADMQQPAYGRPDYGRYPEMQKIVLTPEEATAWQECMRSSSILPPVLLSAAVSYGLFKMTPFRAQAKYAAVVGGALGLLSNRMVISQLCLSKVAAMPNSNLRHRLSGIQHRNQSEEQYQGIESSDVKSSSSAGTSTEIVFDDYPPMNSYDTYSSLNDSSDVPTTDDMDLTEPINMQKKDMSYDELRHRNREEYYNKNRQWHGARAPARSPATSETAQQQVPAAASSTPMEEKTKYGDVWG